MSKYLMNRLQRLFPIFPKKSPFSFLVPKSILFGKCFLSAVYFLQKFVEIDQEIQE